MAVAHCKNFTIIGQNKNNLKWSTIRLPQNISTRTYTDHLPNSAIRFPKRSRCARNGRPGRPLALQRKKTSTALLPSSGVYIYIGIYAARRRQFGYASDSRKELKQRRQSPMRSPNLGDLPSLKGQNNDNEEEEDELPITGEGSQQDNWILCTRRTSKGGGLCLKLAALMEKSILNSQMYLWRFARYVYARVRRQQPRAYVLYSSGALKAPTLRCVQFA